MTRPTRIAIDAAVDAFIVASLCLCAGAAIVVSLGGERVYAYVAIALLTVAALRATFGVRDIWKAADQLASERDSLADMLRAEVDRKTQRASNVVNISEARR